MVAAVQRGRNGMPGHVRTRVLADVTAASVEQVVTEMISTYAEIHTDESRIYPPATKGFRAVVRCSTAKRSTAGAG